MVKRILHAITTIKQIYVASDLHIIKIRYYLKEYYCLNINILKKYYKKIIALFYNKLLTVKLLLWKYDQCLKIFKLLITKPKWIFYEDYKNIFKWSNMCFGGFNFFLISDFKPFNAWKFLINAKQIVHRIILKLLALFIDNVN